MIDKTATKSTKFLLELTLIIGIMVLLGACRIRVIVSQIEAFSKIKHSHIVTIGVYACLRALIFVNNEDMGEKGRI